MSDSAIAYSVSDESTLERTRAIKTILYGGLAVGVLDALDASIFFGLWRGAGFTRVWQGVASGLLGRDAAVSGGLKTALLGLLLHFMIATIITAIYYFASLRLPMLVQRAVVWGMIYGVVVHFTMGYIVIPLSAISRFPTFSFSGFLNGVIGHALLVGLPIALITRRFAKANRG